jgi:biotin transport system substrate-specific component
MTMMNHSISIDAKQLTGWRAFAATFVGAALTVACAKLAFYLPGNPVPVTMQVFAVILCGMVLGSRLGALAQLSYFAAGLAGAPVFASGKFGIAALLSPTGGYIIGFVAAAYVVGLLTERLQRPAPLLCGLAGLIGVFVIYTFGAGGLAVWLSVVGGKSPGMSGWMLGAAPFLALDAAKVGLATITASAARRIH